MPILTMITKMGEGFGRTCAIFFLTLLFSLPLGLGVCLLRMSKKKLIDLQKKKQSWKILQCGSASLLI